MSVFLSEQDTARLYVQFFLDQNNPKSKSFSARMSWSMSEILKSFKKLAVVCYQR